MTWSVQPLCEQREVYTSQSSETPWWSQALAGSTQISRVWLPEEWYQSLKLQSSGIYWRGYLSGISNMLDFIAGTGG